MKLTFVFFIFILFIFLIQQSCTNSQKSIKYLIEPTNVDSPISFPQTYYISPNFSKHEINVLQDSVDLWSIKTGGIIQINLKQWNPNKPFDQDFYYKYSKKTVWKLSKKDKIRMDMFKKRKDTFAGLSSGDYVILIEEYTDNAFRLKAVFSHEMGHQFGLSHIKKEYPAILNTNCGPGIITKYDLKQFCYYYNCKYLN